MTEHSMTSTEAWCILRVCLIPVWFSWFPICVPFCPIWHKHKSGTQYHVLRTAAYADYTSHSSCTTGDSADENKVWIPLGTNMIVAGRCYVMTQKMARWNLGDDSWNESPLTWEACNNRTFRDSTDRFADPCWKFTGSVKLGSCKELTPPSPSPPPPSPGGPPSPAPRQTFYVAKSWTFWNNAHCSGGGRQCWPAVGPVPPGPGGRGNDWDATNHGPECFGWGKDLPYLPGLPSRALTFPITTFGSCYNPGSGNMSIIQELTTEELDDCVPLR